MPPPGAVVPANPPGIWTHVYACVGAPRRLRFRATGQWDVAVAPMANRGAGGGGLLPGALNGSLVGKMGGGTADSSVPTAGTAAPAGSPCSFAARGVCQTRRQHRRPD